MKGLKNHPYIPNSNPVVQQEMLEYLGLKTLEDLHEEIPDDLKFKGKMNIPEPIISEYDLKRHVEGILAKNSTCKENLCFIGGGCAPHYVPAICDEINSRGEFLTAYGGESYNDFGRFQALFEYESLVGELVGMDVVNVPTMDYGQAAATAVRMATRITERLEVLVSDSISPERLLIISNYCKPFIKFERISFNKENGLLNLEDLKAKLNQNTACVYFENPSYLGFLETQGEQIAELTHNNGSLLIVGLDPISLGLIAPPSEYGADIICGDLQPLGIHMNFGGGQSGFIATRDEEKFVMEYPSRLFGITSTSKEGEYAFADVAYDRTSFGHHREHGKEYVGTQTALWGITAGVYLSLLGPQGMAEVSQTILQKNLYAKTEIGKIKNVKISPLSKFSYKEFIVDFNDTGLTVKKINKKLLKYNIFGGKDISGEFPKLGESALYCVTEVHTKEDIDKLVDALKEIVKGGK